jgi:hypothetical protein
MVELTAAQAQPLAGARPVAVNRAQGLEGQRFSGWRSD